jgi:hypothetical protein
MMSKKEIAFEEFVAYHSNGGKDSANRTQVGGSHYRRHKYETWDVIADWELGYFDGNAVKYLSRWRYKHATPEGRIADLEKARHYIDKLIEMEREL